MITDNTQVVINLLKGIDELIEKYEHRKAKNEHLFKDLDPDKHKANRFCTRGKILAYNSILRDLKELKK